MAKKKVKKAVKKKATKKAAKKKTSKKKIVKKAPKKSVKKVARKPMKSRQVRATPRRVKFTLRNLILFIILALISYLLYVVSNNAIYETFFYFLAMILGFIALAFLISLLVFLVLRMMRK